VTTSPPGGAKRASDLEVSRYPFPPIPDIDGEIDAFKGAIKGLLDEQQRKELATISSVVRGAGSRRADRQLA
jgi:hypothetical protein